MGKADYWKYYMGFDVPCGGLSVSPKPVRLMDWEKFIPVAYEMLRLNNELLRKRLKLDESILLYDYVMDYMIKMAEERFGQEGSFALVLISSVFSLCYRLPVEPMLQKKDGEVNLVFKIGDNDEDLITRDNYEEIRAMIMEQNLIFEPIIAPNKKSQDIIDKAIEDRLKVMDQTAFALCREGNMPIIVFDMNQKGNLTKLVKGEKVGTLVHV